MSTLLEIFQQVIGRRPDRRDKELIHDLSARLPGDVLDDVGMMTEVVIRADHIRQLETVLDRAGDIARRKAEIDGEKYAIDAANKVWRRVLDHLPVDSATIVRRFCYAIAAYAVVALIVGAVLGWALRERRYEAARTSHQAAMEQEFTRCIDAAEGRAHSARSSRSREPHYSSEVFRSQARTCAAEYADRRAIGF